MLYLTTETRDYTNRQGTKIVFRYLLSVYAYKLYTTNNKLASETIFLVKVNNVRTYFMMRLRRARSLRGPLTPTTG